MGDPGGVGPEIVLKAVSALRTKAIFILVGRGEVFNKANRLLKPPIRFAFLRKGTSKEYLFQNSICILETKRPRRAFTPRRVSSVNGSLAFEALREGARLARDGFASALVTGPVSKSAIRKVKPRFTDQTDFLAHFCRTPETAMSFMKGKACVTLVTTHLPVHKVALALTSADIVRKSELTAAFLKNACGIKEPRLGVLGLNPHAGEGGMLGKEERNIILPAIRKLKRMDYTVSGPLSADSAFYFWRLGRFDAIIAMYHDQGLAPFKMLHFHDGVHITLGLPFVRTSPDHGTAFDLAYRRKASPKAMIEAIKTAIVLSKKPRALAGPRPR